MVEQQEDGRLGEEQGCGDHYGSRDKDLIIVSAIIQPTERRSLLSWYLLGASKPVYPTGGVIFEVLSRLPPSSITQSVAGCGRSTYGLDSFPPRRDSIREQSGQNLKTLSGHALNPRRHHGNSQSLHVNCFLFTNSLPAVASVADVIRTAHKPMEIGARVRGLTKFDTWPSGGFDAGKAQRSNPEMSLKFSPEGLFMVPCKTRGYSRDRNKQLHSTCTGTRGYKTERASHRTRYSTALMSIRLALRGSHKVQALC